MDLDPARFGPTGGGIRSRVCDIQATRARPNTRRARRPGLISIDSAVDRQDGTGVTATLIGIASNDKADDVSAAQHAIGSRFAGYRLNLNMAFPMPGDEELGWNSSGLWVYRNANCEDPRTRPVFGGWAGVVSGRADEWLDIAAHGIRRNFTSARPFLYSPHHEQAVHSSHQCGIGCNGTPADYRAFFRYVVEFFRNKGVGDRVRFCCVPLSGQYKNDDPSDGISVVDPGPEWVDIYGCDSYTRGLPLDKISPRDAGIDVVGQYAADRDRLAMIGEFGVHANTPQAAGYLRAALDLFKSQGNWFAVLTDTASMGSQLIPVWRDAANDPAFRFAAGVPTFDANRGRVTEDGYRIGPRTDSPEVIAAWLSDGGYDAIGGTSAL